MSVEVKDPHDGSPLSDYQIYYERPKRITTKKSYREFASEDENSEVEAIADDFKRRKLKVPKKKESPSYLALERKQKQMTETLRWLGENYELREGMCLPRCVMYTHYLDFCKKSKLCPSGPATFGKIIRQKFPKLTTRRLGTRGQSKYHYYGIQVSESSPYFHSGYSKQGLTRFSSMKIKGEVQVSNKKFPLGNKTRTLLPEFPDAKKFSLPKGVSQEKVETFIMMYRTHCQRLLDTVISANFDGVQNFILHFWQGMPQHMKSVLESPLVVDIIAICDSILYKVLIDVLIPSSIQDLPDSLREEIREFATNMLEWLRESLSEAPSAVREAKYKMAQTFGNALTRQVSFVHLAQTARSVLLSYDSVSRMMNDLRRIDFKGIIAKVTFITDNMQFPAKVATFVKEFENLLSKQAPLEAYTEWLDGLVDKCVLKESSQQRQVTFKKKAADFLGLWSLFTSKILEDLTLKSAPSFGVFHLIQTTFQEYVLLIMENQKLLEMDKNLHLSLQMQTKLEFQEEGFHIPFPKIISNESLAIPLKAEKTTTQITMPLDKRTADSNNNAKPKRIHIADREIVLSKQVPQAKHPITVTPIPRQIPTSSSSMGSPIYTSNQGPAYTVSASANERYQARPMPQYNYSMENMTSHVPEMTSYHGDYVNSVEKNVYPSNATITSPEFTANNWMQNGGQSLTVLNPVNYDTTGSIAENSELGYQRTADFGLGYTTDPSINQSVIHPMEIPTTINHRLDQFPYNHPAARKEEFLYSNAFSRYNNMYFDSIRSAGQGNPDMMNFGPFMQQPVAPMEFDNLVSGHDAQMNRLQGVGTV